MQYAAVAAGGQNSLQILSFVGVEAYPYYIQVLRHDILCYHSYINNLPRTQFQVSASYPLLVKLTVGVVFQAFGREIIFRRNQELVNGVAVDAI